MCDLSFTDHSLLLSEKVSGFITVQYNSHLIMYLLPLHPLLAGIKSINLQRLCKMGVGSFTSKDKPATNIFK